MNPFRDARALPEPEVWLTDAQLATALAHLRRLIEGAAT